jgi:N-acetylmuramoyl-L-alanine amidase
MILAGLLLALQLADSVTVLTVSEGSRRTSVPIVVTAAGPLIRVADAFPTLGVSVARQGRENVSIAAGAVGIELTLGMPFARSGTQTLPLAAAPVERDGELLVPMALLTEVLPKIAPEFRYDPAAATVTRLTPRVAGASLPSSGGRRGAASATPMARANGDARARRLVVVDAGHGGPDRGMKGPIGVRNQVHEADITLAVSKRLRDQFQSRGVDVLMTRTTDTLIALDDRGRMANEAAADLFLSIHVNAANVRWRNPRSARGFETYFLAEAKTEDEQRVAEMENESMRFEVDVQTRPGDPLSFLLNDMMQNEFLRESSTLAATVQSGLRQVHPSTDRGVKQAGFRVLITAHMPAVLVELGFGTNTAEVRWLSSARGQQALARAIADATIRYLDDYDRRVNGGRGSP